MNKIGLIAAMAAALIGAVAHAQDKKELTPQQALRGGSKETAGKKAAERKNIISECPNK